MDKQLDEDLTELENRIFDELFIAIYFNDIEKVIEIKENIQKFILKRKIIKLRVKKHLT